LKQAQQLGHLGQLQHLQHLQSHSGHLQQGLRGRGGLGLQQVQAHGGHLQQVGHLQHEHIFLQNATQQQ